MKGRLVAEYNMTIGDYFTLLSIIFGVLSAGCWSYASWRGIRNAVGGYDMDLEVAAEARRSAGWNGVGAAFAALAVACTSATTAAKVVPWMKWAATSVL